MRGHHVRLGKCASPARFKRWLEKKRIETSHTLSRLKVESKEQLQNQIHEVDQKWTKKIFMEDKIFMEETRSWNDVMVWNSIVELISVIRRKQAGFLYLDKGVPNPMFNSFLMSVFLFYACLLYIPYLISHSIPGLFVFVVGPLFLLLILLWLLKRFRTAKNKYAENINNSVNHRRYKVNIQGNKTGKNVPVSSYGATGSFISVDETEVEMYTPAFDIEKSIEINYSADRHPSFAFNEDRVTITSITLAKLRDISYSTRSDFKGDGNEGKDTGSMNFNKSRKFSAADRTTLNFNKSRKFSAADRTTQLFRGQWINEDGVEMSIRQDVCFSILFILGAVFFVAIFWFTVVHSSVGLHMIAYEGFSYGDTVNLIMNYSPYDRFRDCSLDAFETGDILGIFEFFALF